MESTLHHLLEIQAFVSSVQHGSFTLAGKQLGITRSAVGKRIARLESALNTRLLQRSTRSLALTEEGQLLYDRCVLILSDLGEVQAALAERQATPSGRLRITVPATLGKQFVLQKIAAYLAEFPEITVDIIMVDRYVDLIAEKVDVAIRIGVPNPKSELIARRIGTYKMLTVASPDYLAQHGTPQHPNELSHHSLIAFVHTQEVLGWQYQVNKELVTLLPQQHQPRLTIDNEAALITFAKQGFGITQVTDILAQPAIERGELVPILTPYQAEGYPIFVIYPSRKQLSAKVRKFVERLAM